MITFLPSEKMSFSYSGVFLSVYLLHMIGLCVTTESQSTSIPSFKSYTFKEVVSVWQRNRCIFPAVSWYQQAEELLDDSPLFLDPCRNLEKSTDSNDQVLNYKKLVCQLFYRITFKFCEPKKHSFVENCLTKEIFRKMFQDHDACLDISELKFSDSSVSINNTLLCKKSCGESSDLMGICKYFGASIHLYKHNATDNCTSLKEEAAVIKTGTTETKDVNSTPQKETIEASNQKTQSDPNANKVNLTNPTLANSTKSNDLTTKKEVPETKSTIIETSTNISKAMNKSSTSNNSSAELKAQDSKPADNNTLTMNIHKEYSHTLTSQASQTKTNSTSDGTASTAQSPEKSNQGNDKDKSQSQASTNGESTEKPIDDGKKGDTSLDKTKIVLNKTSESVGSDASSTVVQSTTGRPKVQPESKTGTKEDSPPEQQNKSQEENKTDDNVGNNDTDLDIDDGYGNNKGNDHLDSDDDKIDVNSTEKKPIEEKTSNTKKTTKTDISNEIFVNDDDEDNSILEKPKKTQEKKIAGVKQSVETEVEESPGSGHFLAYFLTAVVICITGYVIYHNRQKILAFVIEGRNSGRNGRQRSKEVKYTQLKSNVEEVLPSLEQVTTSKNFVY